MFAPRLLLDRGRPRVGGGDGCQRPDSVSRTVLPDSSRFSVRVVWYGSAAPPPAASPSIYIGGTLTAVTCAVSVLTEVLTTRQPPAHQTAVDPGALIPIRTTAIRNALPRHPAWPTPIHGTKPEPTSPATIHAPPIVEPPTMSTTPKPDPNRRNTLRPLDRLLMLASRDKWLLEMLVAHTALTTGQVTRLGYAPTATEAHERLLNLARDGWISSVPLDAGVENTCWLLAPLAAQAYKLDPSTRSDPPPIPDDPTLTGTVRTNGFFVDLAGYARTHAGVDLRQWWSPPMTHPLVSPDLTRTRYAEYIADGRRINFWFEDDDEGVSPARLGARLLRYRDVLLRTGLGTVLVRMANEQREAEFHRDLPLDSLYALTIATVTPQRASTAARACGSTTPCTNCPTAASPNSCTSTRRTISRRTGNDRRTPSTTNAAHTRSPSPTAASATPPGPDSPVPGPAPGPGTGPRDRADRVGHGPRGTRPGSAPAPPRRRGAAPWSHAAFRRAREVETHSSRAARSTPHPSTPSYLGVDPPCPPPHDPTAAGSTNATHSSGSAHSRHATGGCSACSPNTPP
jgi:Replication-relaxation